MCEVREIYSCDLLKEDIIDIRKRLERLHTRIKAILDENSEPSIVQEVCLTHNLFSIRRMVKSLSDDIMKTHSLEPNRTAIHMWQIIELYSYSSEGVIEGTNLLERFSKQKLRSMIEPSNYLGTIMAYVQWENETVRCFVQEFKKKPRNSRLIEIERLWNWNFRKNEGIFFGGAARPIHLKRVTEFSELMSMYYDSLWPIYKENRNSLAEALIKLLRQESAKYWPDYEIYPCKSSNTIMDKFLHYFFFKNRKNTWFINSSSSDYIPFVNSAREIFAEKFIGSNMRFPHQHNTMWILNSLTQHCSNIYAQQKDKIKPIIIILLTSKNRFGHRIDVDFIHSDLSQHFPTIITMVDGCQDGKAFTDVDIVIYTKRFTTIGAIALVNKSFLAKNELLYKKLSIGTNFSAGILAQLYITINMANTNHVYGVEDLVNSARWHSWQCPILDELHSAIDYSCSLHIVEHFKGPIKYSFTEDVYGTIISLTSDRRGHSLLPKLWALLKKQGHTLDCFVMDNRYLESSYAVHSNQVREMIAAKFINGLRCMETLSSDYLVWPLVPFWVSTPDDISVKQLNEHFDTCMAYHDCLRIAIGRCSYPGKLNRFIHQVDNIFRSNALDISDNCLGQHTSQWPS